jgi:hypothetical protein
MFALECNGNTAAKRRRTRCRRALPRTRYLSPRQTQVCSESDGDTIRMGRGIYPNRGMFGDAAVKNALCICAAPCGSGVHAPQHFLYFLPLPQGHGSFLPVFGVALLIWEDKASKLD